MCMVVLLPVMRVAFAKPREFSRRRLQELNTKVSILIYLTGFWFLILVDPETGKKIRGQKCEVRDYDQFVFDIYAKYIPQPVEIKTQDSVYDHYDILEEIGTGAFGVVHRCRELKTQHVFAAKFIPIGHAMEKALIRKEIDIMNHLHHCKLINLHDAFEDEDEMVLIFEL